MGEGRSGLIDVWKQRLHGDGWSPHNFWKVDHLSDDTSACSVIRKLKLNFATYGIPQKLVSDNGPQFTSQEFNTFTVEWEIEHDLTSPFHPQAYGKAESAVKMAKTLLKKSRHSKSDFYLMLLEYKNTPTHARSCQWAQLLHSECSVERYARGFRLKRPLVNKIQ